MKKLLEEILANLDGGPRASSAGVVYPPLPRRDVDATSREIDAMVRYRLETLPSDDPPVVGMTPELSKDLAVHIVCSLDEFGSDDSDHEACPGCGCRPGDGLTDGCDDADGCGFFRAIR